MEKITKRKDGNLHIETINEEPSLTQQQFAEACDINNIIARYEKTGELPMQEKRGQYIDQVGLPTYQEALDIVNKAQTSFADLPAPIRKRFDNDPSQMISFLEDEKNHDEARKLGMLKPLPDQSILTPNPNTQTQNQTPNQTPNQTQKQ